MTHQSKNPEKRRKKVTIWRPFFSARIFLDPTGKVGVALIWEAGGNSSYLRRRPICIPFWPTAISPKIPSGQTLASQGGLLARWKGQGVAGDVGVSVGVSLLSIRP